MSNKKLFQGLGLAAGITLMILGYNHFSESGKSNSQEEQIQAQQDSAPEQTVVAQRRVAHFQRYLRAGNAFFATGKFPEAETKFLAARAEAEKLGENETPAFEYVAICNYKIAKCQEKLNKPHEAQKSLELAAADLPSDGYEDIPKQIEVEMDVLRPYRQKKDTKAVTDYMFSHLEKYPAEIRLQKFNELRAKVDVLKSTGEFSDEWPELYFEFSKRWLDLAGPDKGCSFCDVGCEHFDIVDRTLMDQKKYREAIPYLKKAIYIQFPGMNSFSDEPARQLAIAYRETGNEPDAKKLEQIYHDRQELMVVSPPPYPLPQFNDHLKTALLAVKAGDKEKAAKDLAFLQQWHTEHSYCPGDTPSRDLFVLEGLVAYLNGHHDQLISNFQKALEFPHPILGMKEKTKFAEMTLQGFRGIGLTEQADFVKTYLLSNGLTERF